MLPLSEKLKVLNLVKEKKKSYTEAAEIYGKNETIVRKEKEICASFAVSPQTAKIMATACGQYLVKMEKALNLHKTV